MIGLLRAVTRSSNCRIQTGFQNQGLTLSLSRQLSTQTEAPQQNNNSSDSFLQNPSTGLVYGKIYGIGRHTRKSDIISMLGASKLSLNDVRFEYNQNYAPVAVMIQFPSRNAYDASLKVVVRKSRLFRMERADRQQWDILPRYDGKAILLQGIPRNALIDDVERFLSGCEYDGSSIQMFARQQRGFDRPPPRMVLVQFPSLASATHAFITKNRSFCLNNQVAVRLLQ